MVLFAPLLVRSLLFGESTGAAAALCNLVPPASSKQIQLLQSPEFTISSSSFPKSSDFALLKRVGYDENKLINSKGKCICKMLILDTLFHGVTMATRVPYIRILLNKVSDKMAVMILS